MEKQKKGPKNTMYRAANTICLHREGDVCVHIFDGFKVEFFIRRGKQPTGALQCPVGRAMSIG